MAFNLTTECEYSLKQEDPTLSPKTMPRMINKLFFIKKEVNDMIILAEKRSLSLFQNGLIT